MKKVSLILLLLLALTLLPAGLTACSGGGEKSTSQKTSDSYDSKASKEAETSKEADTADLEKELMGKWLDLIPTSKSSIEFFDNHTAVLTLADKTYDVEWEVTKSNPQLQSLDLSFKINGNDAFTGSCLKGKDGLLTLSIDGNDFQYMHE